MSGDARRFRFFDTHLHVPTPAQRGWDDLHRHLDAHPNLVGGLLILNTAEEIDLVAERADEVPPTLTVVPAMNLDHPPPPEVSRAGWYKIHPPLLRLDRAALEPFVERVAGLRPAPRGLVVHHYPWGPALEHEISLPLIIALARALPDVPILATHGGGYESWALRAHTGSLPNVHYDFACTLAYYAGSDLLGPFKLALQRRPERLHFGSDWPVADPLDQIAECLRLAAEVGVDPAAIEARLLENARRLWPVPVPTVP